METNKRIEFTRIRDVKAPNRANKHDAGTDFYVPEYSEEFLAILKEKNAANKLSYETEKDENGNVEHIIIVPGGEQINIPSGIKVNILDKNTYLDANNKSGVATKFHLTTGAKVVDADYQGEVHLNMMNVGNTPVKIKYGMKIVQFIHKYYIDTEWSEISNEQYNNIEVSDRGAGGFSSTGLK